MTSHNSPKAPATTARNVSVLQLSIIKGLAIIPVLVVHFFASLDKAYVSPQGSWYTTFDQLGRYCVPLFVAASAYGLALKYSVSEFELLSFLKRRVFKLIPLYLLWCVILFACFRLTDLWHPNTGKNDPFWQQVLTGGVDYHLYFVPMIFQLYLLFPLLLWLAKRQPWLLMLASVIVQLGLFWYYQHVQVTLNDPDLYFFTDQEQYVFAGTWIIYFCIGLVAALQLKVKDVLHRVWWLLALVTIYVGFTNVVGVDQAIKNGLDPIKALRFTRLPIVVYGGVVSWLLLSHQGWVRWIPTVLQKPLAELGKYSFVLFLCHTLALRILFGAWEQDVSLPVLAVSTGLLIAGFWLSKKLSA